MKRKAWVILVLGLLVLGLTSLTEYLFYRQEENTWVRRFEKRLHQEEVKADQLLATFKDSVDILSHEWDEDLIFVGFREGKIVFWTNKAIGTLGLYHELSHGGRLVEINNAYYEVRRYNYKDIEYFALLHIKSNYPYTNKYVKNRFGSFLKITSDNIDDIEVSPIPAEHSLLISDKDHVPLFYITYSDNYKERAFNVFLLFFYLLFFLSLFYVYDILQKNAPTLKLQLLYFVLFVGVLIGIRYVVTVFHIPASCYSLPIFDNTISKDFFISSIGDLLLTVFCIFQILYITFSNLKINYQNVVLKHYRYVIGVIFILFAYLYVNFFNFAISLVVENMDIHMNVARLVHVGWSSVIGFSSVIVAGLVIVVIIYSSVTVFQRILSFGSVVVLVTVTCSCLCLISYVWHTHATFWDCFFIWIVFLLLAVNKYLVKRDVQRSMYILVIFLLSIYQVMIVKTYEHDKELRQRASFATELIEERDYNFEKRLVEISEGISFSPKIADLVKQGDAAGIDSLLWEKYIAGYNYYTDITLCRPLDSLLLTEDKELWNCREYFNSQIRRFGRQVGNSHFYSISEFDGWVTYIGKFRYKQVILYVRFDVMKDNEGDGYPQILSRQSVTGMDNIYRYSYAKYKNGELISSSGDFIYYKKSSSFGELDKDIKVVVKDRYSHMLIPVEKNAMVVVSLHDNTFSLYYMNVLYAFFVCIIVSSYGLFFNVNRNINFRRGTLKARIKNNVISLIFVLFVLLTALSIYVNTRSFEERHNAKTKELQNYINKELERFECVDSRVCPEITKTLSDMSEVLLIDINIYLPNGFLVSTSRPEIFQNGFDGLLINPRAMDAIGREGTMSYILNERIGNLEYMSAYMPLILDNGKTYILNVPYFAQNDELNMDILIMVIITVNIAIIMMVLAFILSGLLAERVTKPLQLVNDKLRLTRIGGKNEKIVYDHKDEVGALVLEYNNMVDKLDESIVQLAKSERESAWREMARQIAHEIKNPLTPMKLNVQFMQRSLALDNPEQLKERFKKVSSMLIEQIDNMASIASAFSDFAKMPIASFEEFDLSELVKNCVMLFKNNIQSLKCQIEPGLRVFADKEQIRRVFINILKNAEQSIPEDRDGEVLVVVHRVDGRIEVRIKDNGCGIPEDLRSKIFEPNFTTKSSGTGLGLAISNKIVESMGGTIDFTSEIGRGSEFVVTLDGIK